LEKPEGKETFKIPRRRWKDQIKMYLQNWYGRAWIGFIWLRRETGGGLL
jgi:hypothetical protein